MRTTPLLVSALFTAFVLAAPAIAQDKAKAAAGKGTTKQIIDNEKVVVTEVRYKPGEASDMRERGARVTRALTDGTMERTYPDGKKEMVHWKAGQVKYFPKETFANRNIGKKEMALFVTTLK